MAVTYEPIATTTLGSAASSITFSSIPNTYTDLRVVFVPTVSTGASDYLPKLTYNTDTGTNYSNTGIVGDGTSASIQNSISNNYIDIVGSFGYKTTPSMYTIDIFSYAGSTYKTCLFTQIADYNGSGNVTNGVGLWRSTSVINQIVLTSQNTTNKFAIGTTATLWGIKAA